MLIPIFSALRLAKFNIDEAQTKKFIGLPTPANALFFVSIVIFLESTSFAINENYLYKALLFLIILFSYLLTSKVSFFSLKFSHFKWKDNEIRWYFLALSVIVVLGSFFLSLTALTLSFIILLYLILSLFNNITTKNEI